MCCQCPVVATCCPTSLASGELNVVTIVLVCSQHSNRAAFSLLSSSSSMEAATSTTKTEEGGGKQHRHEADTLTIPTLYQQLRLSTLPALFSPSQLDPHTFRQHFLCHNRPCMWREEHMTDQWNACQQWRVKLKTTGADAETAATATPPSLTDTASNAMSQQFQPEAVHQLLINAKRIIQASFLSAPPTTSCSPAHLPAVRSLPNFDFLLSTFGHQSQPISVSHVFPQAADASSASSTHISTAAATSPASYGSECVDMPLTQFLLNWQQQMHQRLNPQQPSAHSIPRQSLLYCKDFHLALIHPQYEAYHTPLHFQDDWMNHDKIHPVHTAPSSDIPAPTAAASSSLSATASQSDDFRFCYMGPAGTMTALHSDVYNSFSWSANVVGRKLWLMMHPHWRPILTQQSEYSTATHK